LNDKQSSHIITNNTNKHPKNCRIISRMIFYEKKGSPGGITEEGKEKEL
jgi:hypothetical protein